MLTPKQEAFAQGLASGLSQSEAFRQAYPKALAWKNATVWRKASLLAGHGDVQARVDQLRQEIADLDLWTRKDSVRVLREVADGDKGAERVQAVKELNLMHGFNEPVKVAVEGGLNLALELVGVLPKDADD